MMRFRGRLSLPKLDAERFTKAYQEAAETQVRQAARAWLRAVIPKVPVWAGTSRGTLQPLGRFLRVAVPIAVKVTLPGKGPSIGAAKSEFKFIRDGKRFYFRWGMDVEHFIQNEYYGAPPNIQKRLKNPTPWNAIKSGEDAFKEYMETLAKQRLPRLKDYIKFDAKRIDP